jgi:1-acyl-sn-glycerol-3-phosphate acyltransferase
MLFRVITAASLVISAVLLFALDIALWAAALVFVVSFLALCALAFGFLWFVCERVDLNQPRAEKDDPFYRAVMYLYIEALITLVMARIHTKGLEKTPREGRFLLVCNHLFLADPGVLLHVFKKSQLAFITKQENFEMPIISKFMHKILCQPVDRDNDRQALKTILKCISLIKEDKVSMGVFPEGYTSKDGKLHPFRAGVFKIAQKTNVPIVVCTIQNTRQIFRNLKKLKHTDIHLHLVDVIQPEAYKGLTTMQLSDMVYEKMIGDLGEEFRYCEA